MLRDKALLAHSASDEAYFVSITIICGSRLLLQPGTTVCLWTWKKANSVFDPLIDKYKNKLQRDCMALFTRVIHDEVVVYGPRHI